MTRIKIWPTFRQQCQLTRWQLGVLLVAVEDLVLDKLGEVGQVVLAPAAAAGEEVAPSLVLDVIRNWENTNVKILLYSCGDHRILFKCAGVMKTSSVTFLLWSKFWFCLSSQPWIYNVWSMKIRKKQFGLIYWWYDSVPERIKSIWFRL